MSPPPKVEAVHMSDVVCIVRVDVANKIRAAAVRAERVRIAAMLRAQADVEMQGYRWGWYDMAMRLRKWADTLESTGTI